MDMYVEAYRSGWKEAGYKYSTLMVHEDDKSLVTALTGVLVFARLLRSAIDGDTPVVEFAATRNIAAMPSLTEYSRIMEKLRAMEDRNAKALAKNLETVAQKHIKYADQHFKKLDADPANVKHEAAVVCHRNLAVRYMSLVSAIVDRDIIDGDIDVLAAVLASSPNVGEENG